MRKALNDPRVPGFWCDADLMACLYAVRKMPQRVTSRTHQPGSQMARTTPNLLQDDGIAAISQPVAR